MQHPATWRKTSRTWAARLALAGLCAGPARAQLPAFPGAEGAGAVATGGRGTASSHTTVFEVTSLSDATGAATTPGTLRYALTASASYRTVVFRVSGTIHLTAALKVTKANTTLAGQTAPGDGICLADYPVTISADNVIVRYLRFRLGDKNQNLGMVDGSGGDDALDSTNRSTLIVDHCSISWSDDEACTFYGASADNLTLQWNLISEPLNYSYHFETGDADYEHHGYGGIWGGQHASFHHNLFAHCNSRTPRWNGTRYGAAVGSENCDFRNNVLYDWGSNNVYGGEGGNYNVVNNYYLPGPATLAGVRGRLLNPYKQTSAPALPYGQFYLTGNVLAGNAPVTAHNWRGVTMDGGTAADTTQAKVSAPFALPAIGTQTATAAYTAVLAGAGCVRPHRDALDQRIVSDVRNNTGNLIDVQGGYPHGTPYATSQAAWSALASAAAPADTDHDGMSDAYETAHALNPANAADRYALAANGYTNLENYLNDLAASPLPVELTAFAAARQGGAVALAWRTASEQHSARFEVERSADGQQFERIGEVAAQGSKASPTAYTYLDNHLTPPLSQSVTRYYRLHQFDTDGTASYSPVRSVTVGGQGGLTLYPNPARAAVAVAGLSAGATVEVLDALGRTVAHATAEADGTARLALPAGLAAGVYVVRSGSQVQRLAVE